MTDKLVSNTNQPKYLPPKMTDKPVGLTKQKNNVILARSAGIQLIRHPQTVRFGDPAVGLNQPTEIPLPPFTPEDDR